MTMTSNKMPHEVKHACARLQAAGGLPLIVGGAVVDVIQGRTPKDFDIEVFGLGWDAIKKCFEDHPIKEVGEAFGILTVNMDGVDIDINIPRTDNRVGKGHKGFHAALDPTMSPKEAARRRDFTINTLSFDPFTGEVVDEWGGLRDLDAGVLRATDPELFVQDPLRALRAMQLLARKAKSVDPATMDLIRSMVDEFDDLAPERVHEEWRKLLLKADKPSVGLNFLRESGWIVHFPELEALIGCGQHPEWHPEGDVWNHSLLVVDQAVWASRLCYSEGIPEEWTEAFMFGALLHDVGKPSTTVFPKMVADGEFPEERLWTAYDHDRAGVPLGESFMRRLTNNKKLTQNVCAIIEEHMQPWNLFQGGAGLSAYKRLHNRLRLDILGWMCRCDGCGKGAQHISDPALKHGPSEACWEWFDEIGPEPVKPILLGRHLLETGLKPGPEIGERLRKAYEVQLDGVDDLDALLKVALTA
jgi:tRNA nucleotidyltransferase (CCA-adding enzyme)